MSKVVVGMSGGVDSSVAAYLLQKEGYEVIGITFRFTEDFDSHDAEDVVKRLNIEHHVLDYRKEFKEKVIDKFISDYKSGITPNPCVMCNKYVKLKFLYDEMQKFGCEYMATGHYAKVRNGLLYKSSDSNKDQTYFLSEVSKEQLSRIIFPLEGIEKSVVRQIASEIGLENALKKDSVDVCFITENFKNYINENILNNPGKVINVVNNEVVGEHKGLAFYTIGQRKGLNIGGMTDKLFVVGKNKDENILYVALGDSNDYLMSDSCIIENVNITYPAKINKCNAKFRYRSSEVEVELEYINENELLVKYDSVKSVTPGQVCSLYLDDICIGGGIIKEVRKNNEKLWYL